VPTGRTHVPDPHAPSRRMRRTGIVIVAALSLLASAPASYADPEPTIAEVTDLVDSLYLDAIQATETYNEAGVKAAEARAALETLQSNLDRLRADLDLATDQTGAIAAAQYRSGGFGPTIQMLLSEDTTDFLARVSQLEQLANRQAQTVAGLQTAKDKLAQQQLAVERETTRLDALTVNLDTAKKEIEVKHQAAQDLLAVLTEEERRRVAAEQAARAAAAAAAAAARAAQAPAEPAGGGNESADSAPAPPPPPPPSGGGSGRAKVAIDYAMAQVGDAYVYGAAGPNAWDCSGLTMVSWGAAGVSLPHSSRLQSGLGTAVSSSQLQPGDLVFYYSPISHVGIYIGNGNLVHAANPSKPVHVAPVFSMPFAGARRVG